MNLAAAVIGIPLLFIRFSFHLPNFYKIMKNIVYLNERFLEGSDYKNYN